MNLLICSLNSQYIHSSLAPWCLLAGVRTFARHPHTARVLEATVNQEPEQVARQIVDAAPQLVGFCCYIWNITRVYQIAALVKEALPSVTVVLGGPEVGYCAGEVLTGCPQADYVLTGEGEYSFARLCDGICDKEPFTVPGVSYRTPQGVVSVPETEELPQPPSPYCQEYLDALQGRIAYLETSRGCPYACAYCLSARCGKLRFYPLQRAKEEMLLLAASGAKTIKLVDRTFNAHRQRAKELWRFIVENYGKAIPKGVCFHFEIAGDLLDEESLAIIALAPAGSMQFEIGIQSFHPETLAYIRRKTDLQKLSANIRQLLAPRNVHVHIDLIAGLPLEDFDTFGQSLNRAYAIKPDMLQMGFLKLLHGAPMREEPERYPCRYHSHPPYEVTATPALGEEELSRLHKAEWALDKLYNSGRFGRSLSLVMEQTGLTPFALFLSFGEQTAAQGLPLAKVAEGFYRFGLSLGVEKHSLRNAMVCDWLAGVRGGKLPSFLQIEDARLKAFRKGLRNHPAGENLPRGTALLYEPLVGVYAEYGTPHPVTGQYELHFVPIEE